MPLSLNGTWGGYLPGSDSVSPGKREGIELHLRDDGRGKSYYIRNRNSRSQLSLGEAQLEVLGDDNVRITLTHPRRGQGRAVHTFDGTSTGANRIAGTYADGTSGEQFPMELQLATPKPAPAPIVSKERIGQAAEDSSGYLTFKFSGNAEGYPYTYLFGLGGFVAGSLGLFSGTVIGGTNCAGIFGTPSEQSGTGFASCGTLTFYPWWITLGFSQGAACNEAQPIGNCADLGEANLYLTDFLQAPVGGTHTPTDTDFGSTSSLCVGSQGESEYAATTSVGYVSNPNNLNCLQAIVGLGPVYYDAPDLVTVDADGTLYYNVPNMAYLWAGYCGCTHLSLR